jgi:hypothetical protein
MLDGKAANGEGMFRKHWRRKADCFTYTATGTTLSVQGVIGVGDVPERRSIPCQPRFQKKNRPEGAAPKAS